MIEIYGLIDPMTQELRYIGKSKNSKKRLIKHISERNLRETYKDRWLRKLYDQNLKPEIIIIDNVEEHEWEFWEIHYISYFKSIGCKLTNGTKGGDQPPSTKGRKHTEESKIKMSLSKKGKSIPWLNNGFRTESHKKNLSKSLTGKKSEKKGKKYEEIYGIDVANELKNKLKKIHTGQFLGEKHPMFGKHHSEETKKKLSKFFTKKVIQKDLNDNIIKKFNSLKEASKETGISECVIKYNCQGKNKNIKNFKWEYGK